MKNTEQFLIKQGSIDEKLILQIEIKKEVADEVFVIEPMKIYFLSGEMGLKLRIEREETTIYIVEI